ncbi:MAG: CoB--CoM heterodisulfide reductase iron-sulfur subunit A family protein, partial [Actinomycetia bacterium]|nr:CoB--CoM heterodisulfide reductase iron-sulfur subunit A family protein [Actinomycetes bacterium]
AEEAMGRLIDRVRPNDLIDVRTGFEVRAVEGSVGAFQLTISPADGSGDGEDGGGAVEVIECGSVIIASGFQHFDPGGETQMYGYYEHSDVIALQDLEAMLKDGTVVRPSNGEAPEKLCFIQCVGSRDRQIGNEYCSKVCCGVASKNAIEIRQLLPDCKVFIFYIDMRMYGYWENEIYWPAQEKHRVQYIKGMVTEVLPKGDKLLVRGEDTTMGRPMEVPMDLVVLSVGMEPSPGTRTLAHLFGVQANCYGFIESVRAPMDVVTTSVPGVFACGAALGPADLEDCASSGAASAAKAIMSVRLHVSAG